MGHACIVGVSMMSYMQQEFNMTYSEHVLIKVSSRYCKTYPLLMQHTMFGCMNEQSCFYLTMLSQHSHYMCQDVVL